MQTIIIQIADPTPQGGIQPIAGIATPAAPSVVIPTPAAATAGSMQSPLTLSSKKGTKIDFIRMMNAWYECGKVEDSNGRKPSKKDYFTWLGQLFNIDLTSYDNDLSNSMASGVAYDKQTRIFDELKAKQQEIYNSK